MMYDECVYVFVCMYRLYSEAAQIKNFYTVLWTSIHVQCMHQKYFKMTFKPVLETKHRVYLPKDN